MKKHFLGIVCFIYTFLILYMKVSDNLKNFLAPQMQKYILWSAPVLLLIGLVMCFNNHINYRFKNSDIILLLPILMLLLAGNGRLSTSLANNRNNFNNTSSKQNISSVSKDENKTNDEEENNIEVPKSENNNTYEEKDNNTKEENKNIENNNTLEDINKSDVTMNSSKESETNSSESSTSKYDFSNIDFDIVDASYSMLSGLLTYPEGNDYELNAGKTIKVRGFAVKNGLSNLPSGYFAIGKYIITCCAADAGFGGFYAKYDLSKIKENTWYEIEGVLEKAKDTEGYNILAINVINIKEIDGNKEEQYAYPCYSYDDGTCSIMDKYNLEN